MIGTSGLFKLSLAALGLTMALGLATPAAQAATSCATAGSQMQPWWQKRAQQATAATVATSNPGLIVIGDSIAYRFPAGLLQETFGTSVLDIGIPGERVEATVWRAANMPLAATKAGKALVIVGTNNLKKDDAQTIATGIMSVACQLHGQLPSIQVAVLGILPRNVKVSAVGDKIAEVNKLLAAGQSSGGYTLVDAGPELTKACGPREKALCELYSDPIHPSFPGFKLIAGKIAQATGWGQAPGGDAPDDGTGN